MTILVLAVTTRVTDQATLTALFSLFDIDIVRQVLSLSSLLLLILLLVLFRCDFIHSALSLGERERERKGVCACVSRDRVCVLGASRAGLALP